MIERSLPFDAFPIRQCVRELVIPVLVRVLLLGVTQLPGTRRGVCLSRGEIRRRREASFEPPRPSCSFVSPLAADLGRRILAGLTDMLQECTFVLSATHTCNAV